MTKLKYQENDLSKLLNVTRGLAILCVVYGHFLQRSLDPLGIDFFQNTVFKFIYSFHMPIFFLLSGYTLVFSLQKRSLLQVVVSRCRTLFIPFISWSILGTLSLFLLGGLGGQGFVLNTLPKYFLNDLILDPLLWFLITLFVSSLILVASINLEKRVGLVAHVFVYLLVISIPLHTFLSIYYIKWFYPFYVLGYFLHRYKVCLSSIMVRNILFVLSLVTLTSLLSFWHRDDFVYVNTMSFAFDDLFSETFTYIYRYAVSIFGIVVFGFVCLYLSKTKIQNGLVVLGVYSLDVYLIQRYIVEGAYPLVVSKFQTQFDFTAPMYLYVCGPIVTLIVSLICIIISRKIMRNNAMLSKFLFGASSIAKA
ncbi:MAG: fucose 4-O-acetylase-like acetyltransferase [Candidatus Omnitrophota bacterium]|jgi:fucose 4-O-acetylase-like acetyltransferase